MLRLLRDISSVKCSDVDYLGGGWMYRCEHFNFVTDSWRTKIELKIEIKFAGSGSLLVLQTSDERKIGAQQPIWDPRIPEVLTETTTSYST